MLDLGLEPSTNGAMVLVEEEPTLEIALPQVFEQPPLRVLRRHRVSNVEALVGQIYVAILIARLVGQHLVTPKIEPDDPNPET